MRFTKSFALLAVLALCLTPIMSFAGPKSSPVADAMPNLSVDGSNHSGSLAIVNTGLVAAGAFHVRIVLDDGATFYVGLAGLAAGAQTQIEIPAARDGKPFSFTIAVDCDNEVTESDEADNAATLHYVS